ncbi:type VII toxin-antitoxin system MntA family adenylyltransferase antitoxin [Desulfosporosinus youngiae]|uniref:Putative nucleotidyltransferase n=1 Tax=Desulfosporosinus youngiae DSM 17734 TaxID=768710 RepID=H5XU71_9FIRM|nr:nucleotidyltransferase domain-containing protein [Desulfosporosinus youngiae]EHQ89167.1 putative nucleotidyltransferase [Desulfosporosinus youngiae DSM 17734]
MIFQSKPFDFQFIRERLKNLPQSLVGLEQQISAVILFGSLAANKETPLSDVDLAILYHKNLSPNQLNELHIRVMGIITDLLQSDDIDVINLNTAPLTIQYGAIKQSKILLLNNRDEYIDYWEQTVKYYLDFKPLLDECNETLLKTLSGR